MKVVRGDFVHNYIHCHDDEAAKLIYDELVKAFMLFPRASNDILKSKDFNAEQLAIRAAQGVNAEQALKLTKLLFLVNKRDEKTGVFETHSKRSNWSVRHLFSYYGHYFDEHTREIEHISHDVQEVIHDKDAAMQMAAHLYDYAAFGGDENVKTMPSKGAGALLLLGFAGITIYALTRK